MAVELSGEVRAVALGELRRIFDEDVVAYQLWTQMLKPLPWWRQLWPLTWRLLFRRRWHTVDFPVSRRERVGDPLVVSRDCVNPVVRYYSADGVWLAEVDVSSLLDRWGGRDVRLVAGATVATGKPEVDLSGWDGDGRL